MADVLINHPYFGSMWLSNCYITDGWIVGDVWDDSEVGDWSLPDDYTGEWQTYGFPISCIRKDPCNLLENKEGGDAGQQDARLRPKTRAAN